MNKFLKILDGISDLQKGMSYILLGLVAVTVIDVMMRYVFKSPIIWGKDMETFMYGSLMLLCAAYTFKVGGHVRIPLIVERFLSPRAQEITSIILYLVFFMPFIIVMLVYGWDFFWKSWLLKETTFTPWHPPIYPMKFIIPLSAFMLLTQGIAEIIRHFIKFLSMGEKYES
jgi:TRAP-type mannitol/chloroaromatic compound transport system permease small subunit